MHTGLITAKKQQSEKNKTKPKRSLQYTKSLCIALQRASSPGRTPGPRGAVALLSAWPWPWPQAEAETRPIFLTATETDVSAGGPSPGTSLPAWAQRTFYGLHKQQRRVNKIIWNKCKELIL